jgi:hypothetical protein
MKVCARFNVAADQSLRVSRNIRAGVCRDSGLPHPPDNARDPRVTS